MRRILFIGLAAIGVAIGCGQRPAGNDDQSQGNFGGAFSNVWGGGSAGNWGYGSPDASSGDDASPLGDASSGDDASPLGDASSDACADAAQDAAPPPPPDAASDACADAGVDAPADAPAGGCTLTQGFWKNHPGAWPVSSLTLGTVTYSESQLLDVLEDPVNGNGLIALAYQLIAAKLNILNGADGSSIAGDISAADALIGSLVVPPIGSGFLDPSVTSTLTEELDSFNEGTTGPGHCND